MSRTSRFAAKLLATFVLAALAAYFLLGWPEAQSSSTGNGLTQADVVRVVDGDTLVVDAGSGEQKVRLIGVDAPESVHPDESRNTEAGKDASGHTAQLLPAGTVVWLERDVSDTDRYGRLLRYVWLEEPVDAGDEEEFLQKTLNARLVREGWAEAKRYEPDVKWADVLERL